MNLCRPKGVWQFILTMFAAIKHTAARALLLEIGLIDNRTNNEPFEAMVEGVVGAMLEVRRNIPFLVIGRGFVTRGCILVVHFHIIEIQSFPYATFCSDIKIISKKTFK